MTCAISAHMASPPVQKKRRTLRSGDFSCFYITQFFNGNAERFGTKVFGQNWGHLGSNWGHVRKMFFRNLQGSRPYASVKTCTKPKVSSDFSRLVALERQGGCVELTGFSTLMER